MSRSRIFVYLVGTAVAVGAVTVATMAVVAVTVATMTVTTVPVVARAGARTRLAALGARHPRGVPAASRSSSFPRREPERRWGGS